MAGEHGIGAIDLVLVSAFILIPFAMLLLSFPIRMEYRSMVDAAAREAVRACATAFDPVTGQARAEAVARQILAERSLRSGAADLSIDCRTSWAPGGVVSARVSLDVPAIDVMIAACARRHGASLESADSDFDLLASVEQQAE